MALGVGTGASMAVSESAVGAGVDSCAGAGETRRAVVVARVMSIE